jgi:hypothetical protein
MRKYINTSISVNSKYVVHAHSLLFLPNIRASKYGYNQSSSSHSSITITLVFNTNYTIFMPPDTNTCNQIAAKRPIIKLLLNLNIHTRAVLADNRSQGSDLLLVCDPHQFWQIKTDLLRAIGYSLMVTARCLSK